MPTESIVGVVLAGGLSSRMGGGDKSLRPLGATTLLGHVLQRLAPQVAAMVLNANGDAARFAGYGMPVVADSVPGFAGPLAGILAGMDWARDAGAGSIVSTAADAPFLPRDLVARLGAARGAARIAVAASAGWRHPTIALWPVSLAEELRQAIEGGERKIDRFTARYEVTAVEFSATPVDPFYNVNTPEELAEAERLLSEAG